MRVAVTGGSGRIGAEVVKELLAHGHEVINLDRRAPLERTAARFVFADLAQREIVQPIFEQVEAVCHLGEIPSLHAGISPEEVFARNARVGSVVLQTAADLCIKRVVSTSSCQVYGMWGSPRVSALHLPMDETHPVQPQNAYGLAKVANELYARMLAEHQGLSVAVFRLPWVVPIDWSYNQAWVDRLRAAPTETEGLGTYVHTTDVARAYRLALEKPRPGFEVYHFSAPEVLSLHPIAQRLRRHHPDGPPLPADWPAFKSPVLTDKARQHLGWQAQFNFLDQYRAAHGEPAEVLA